MSNLDNDLSNHYDHGVCVHIRTTGTMYHKRPGGHFIIGDDTEDRNV